MSAAVAKPLQPTLAEASGTQPLNADENDDLEVVDNEEDQFEAALAAHGSNTWSTGGVRKNIAIRSILQCFGSMIESNPSPDAEPDFRGKYRPEDMLHRKLLDASKQVVKAKR
jgi:hypothetical protein